MMKRLYCTKIDIATPGEQIVCKGADGCNGVMLHRRSTEDADNASVSVIQLLQSA